MWIQYSIYHFIIWLTIGTLAIFATHQPTIKYATFIRLDFIRIYLFNTQFLFDLTLFEFIYLIRNFYSNSC